MDRFFAKGHSLPLAGGCDFFAAVRRYRLLVRLPLARWRCRFSMSCLRSRSAKARWTVRGESPNSRAMVLIPGQQALESFGGTNSASNSTTAVSNPSALS